ncbi:MAG: FAD-dependent thymidylate synthase [Clostridiales bacterium]|nr:FAD-dependent thymidylate synthase [Clostridiales bacterium]
MKVISPSFVIESPVDAAKILKRIEAAGRVCYKSESKITADSAEEFVRRIVRSGHESVLEHASITVRIICDRGVTHEWVRHRIASYSQESTRYCNYTQDRFGNELTFIKPCFWEEDSPAYAIWVQAMENIETAYFELLRQGETAQMARSILPNSLKTEMLVTMNLRAWRNFFKLRTASAAHPQMRELTVPLLEQLKGILPVVFGDLETD